MTENNYSHFNIETRVRGDDVRVVVEQRETETRQASAERRDDLLGSSGAAW